MVSGKIIDLPDLGLGNILGKYTANAHAFGMDMEHDPGRFFIVHVEKSLEDRHDELHGGKVVVEKKHLVEGRLPEFGFCLLNKEIIPGLFIFLSCHAFNKHQFKSAVGDYITRQGSRVKGYPPVCLWHNEQQIQSHSVPMQARSRPRLTVAAIIQKGDQFLFVEERDSRGRLVINQPAGHVEAGESLIEAFEREAFEETGWVVEPRAFLGAYVWGAPDKDISYLRVAIVGEAIRHDPKAQLDQGIEQVLWLSRDALMSRQHQHRSDLVLRCTDDALKGERYPLTALKSLL